MLFKTREEEIAEILKTCGVAPTPELIIELAEYVRDKESESSIDAVRDYSERND